MGRRHAEVTFDLGRVRSKGGQAHPVRPLRLVQTGDRLSEEIEAFTPIGRGTDCAKDYQTTTVLGYAQQGARAVALHRSVQRQVEPMWDHMDWQPAQQRALLRALRKPSTRRYHNHRPVAPCPGLPPPHPTRNISLAPARQLGAASTGVSVAITAFAVVTATRESPHVVKGPDEGLAHAGERLDLQIAVTDPVQVDHVGSAPTDLLRNAFGDPLRRKVRGTGVPVRGER